LAIDRPQPSSGCDAEQLCKFQTSTQAGDVATCKDQPSLTEMYFI
jgi:hypothetical protein